MLGLNKPICSARRVRGAAGNDTAKPL